MSFPSIFQKLSLIIFRSVFTLPWCATYEYLLYHGPQPKKTKKIACKKDPYGNRKKIMILNIFFYAYMYENRKRASHADKFIPT